ncbi:hypothetical protein [Methylobacterium sp. Gmos1]
MRVPEVADRLRVLAVGENLPELAALADHLRRRRPVRKAAPASTPMADELRDGIRDFAKANPTMTYAAIAGVYRVNIGRVSEALAGFRH